MRLNIKLNSELVRAYFSPIIIKKPNFYHFLAMLMANFHIEQIDLKFHRNDKKCYLKSNLQDGAIFRKKYQG